jgi:DNA modification methylase
MLEDNLAALEALREDASVRGQVMLAYLDPPYWTGRQHRMLGTRQETQRGAEAFDDRWPTLADYLTHIRERVMAIRPLLAPAGSLVVHVDPKTSHYIKVLLDEIFGMESFQSEVIWRYRRWPSKTKNFQRVHDVMLRYVNDPEAPSRFTQLYEELAPSTKKTWGEGKQRAVIGDAGKRVRSSTLAEPSPGVPLGDVWEIGIIAPVAKERTGYPTQKPLALLERWIASCTHTDDLVLDPYMGSGTTVVAATNLGRRAIGIDQNPDAYEIAKGRLRELTAPSDLDASPRPVRRARAPSDLVRSRQTA